MDVVQHSSLDVYQVTDQDTAVNIPSFEALRGGVAAPIKQMRRYLK